MEEIAGFDKADYILYRYISYPNKLVNGGLNLETFTNKRIVEWPDFLNIYLSLRNISLAFGKPGSRIVVEPIEVDEFNFSKRVLNLPGASLLSPDNPRSGIYKIDNLKAFPEAGFAGFLQMQPLFAGSPIGENPAAGSPVSYVKKAIAALRQLKERGDLDFENANQIIAVSLVDTLGLDDKNIVGGKTNAGLFREIVFEEDEKSREGHIFNYKINFPESMERIRELSAGKERVFEDLKMQEYSDKARAAIVYAFNNIDKLAGQGRSASSPAVVSSPLEGIIVLARAVFARDPQLVLSGLFKDYLSQRKKLLNLYDRVAEVAKKAAKKNFGVVLYPASGSDISAAVSYADTIVSIDNQDIFTVINTFNLFFDKEVALKEQINSYLEKKLELGFHSSGIRQGFIEYLAELVLLGADLSTFKIVEDRSVGNNRVTTVEFSIIYDNGAKRKIRHTHIKYVFDGQPLPGNIYSELKKVVGDRTDVLLLSKAGADLDGNKKWVAPISNILAPGTTIVSDSVLNITSAKKLDVPREDIGNLDLSRMNNYGYANKSENLGFYEIPVATATTNKTVNSSVVDTQPYLPGFLPKETNESSSPIGGIDFRALPAVIQPVPVFKGQFPAGTAPIIPLAELNKEWEQIENMLNAGIAPSTDRIKDYLAACCASSAINQEADKVLSCLADIMRMEEDRVESTEPALKQILSLLESDKPANEMQLALTKITVLGKEPKALPE